MSRAELEGRIGYVFRDTALLELALSHASFSYEQSAGRGNERLEFLGDAVLGLAIAHELYRGHPDWNEGDLTRARAALVNGRALAEVARRLDLPPHIRLGRTEQASGGEQKDRVLANVLEALIGAIYLDGGLAPAQGFLRRCFAQELTAAGEPLERDPKTALQEWAHAVHRATPSYVTVGDSGQEADDLRFCVEVRIAGQAIASGAGRSKRAAELAAARAALARREPE